MRATIFCCLALGLAVGCGGGDPELPPEGSRDTLISYSRSGGLAPSVYDVTIDASGAAVVLLGEFAGTRREREVQLSSAELGQLRAVLEQNPISEFPEPDPDQVCADCFTYEFAYAGDEYTYDDATQNAGADAVRAAIQELPLPEDTPTGLS
jgi:hypothetical protein